MKRQAYCVVVGLKFMNLTLEEANNLEVFMDGLTARDDWGEPEITWSLNPTGMKDPKGLKKVMTAKKILEIEKESAGKPCGK